MVMKISEYSKELKRIKKTMSEENIAYFETYDVEGKLKIDMKEHEYSYEGTNSGILLILSFIVDIIKRNTNFSEDIIRETFEMGLMDEEEITVEKMVDYKVRVMKELYSPKNDSLESILGIDTECNDETKKLMMLLKQILKSNEQGE